MRYFVISDSSGPVGSVLHDYSSSLFLTRSRSSYLNTALGFCADSIKSAQLRKSTDESVSVYYITESFSEYADKVLEVLCKSGYWSVSESGEFVDIAEFEEFSKSLL
jgi:hypothetical protein